ncbi:hypothetical protein SRHO_G00298080 [Serrasalmus rhombeus]
MNPVTGTAVKHSLMNLIKEEFKQITTVELETMFITSLDMYMGRLLSLFHNKGGAAGRKMGNLLDVLKQDETAEKCRDVVMHGFSENGEDLIKDYGAPIDEMKAELAQHTMKIFTKGGSMEDEPLHAGIVLEGSSGWSVKHSKGMCLATWTNLCCEH